MARRAAAPLLLLLALLGCAAGRVMSEEPMPAAGAVEPANLGKAHAILIESQLTFPNGIATFTVECPEPYVPHSYGLITPLAVNLFCNNGDFGGIALGEPVFSDTCTATSGGAALLRGVCIKAKPGRADITVTDDTGARKAAAAAAPALAAATKLAANNKQPGAAHAGAEPAKVVGKADLVLVGGSLDVPGSTDAAYEAPCPEGYTPFASGAIPSYDFFSGAINALENSLFANAFVTGAAAGSLDFLGVCVSDANPLEVDGTVTPSTRRRLLEQELPGAAAAAAAAAEPAHAKDGKTNLLYISGEFTVEAGASVIVEVTPEAKPAQGGKFIAFQYNVVIDEAGAPPKRVGSADEKATSAVEPAEGVANCVSQQTGTNSDTELSEETSRDGVFVLTCQGGPNGFTGSFYGTLVRSVEPIAVELTPIQDK